MNRHATLLLILLVLGVNATFFRPFEKRQSYKLSGPANSPFPEEGLHGYVPINNNGDDMFYWFFPSRGNPQTDPIVVWYTGGPGCSSSLALLVENGPFMLDANGNPVINPNSWNSNANLLFVDNPIGTGFSHAKLDDMAQVEEDVKAMNLIFYQAWFKLAPFVQYQGRDMYITGESYGGHYVPCIASKLADANDPMIQVKGIMIGNGMVRAASQFASYAPFSVSMTQYTNFTQAQADVLTPKLRLCQYMIQNSPKYTNDQALNFCFGQLSAITSGQNFNVYDVTVQSVGPLGYDFTKQNTFMNSPAVLNALQADKIWLDCDGNVNQKLARLDWIRDCSDDVLNLINKNVRIMGYYGELDWICNWMGGYQWMKDLVWPGQSAFNAAQGADYQGIGMMYYDTNYPNYRFIRFYQAGHMVPMDQPEKALTFLNNFIQGM